jgi:ADP-heptose:LPS heptosyltransferase
MRLRIRENLLILALRLLHGCTQAARADDGMAPRRILAISTTALGDTVWTSVGLASLRTGNPDAEIALLAAKPMLPLVEGRVEADRFFMFHGKFKKFFRTALELRRYAPDTVCIFHGNDPQACALAGFSGASRIYRLPNDRTRFRFLLANQMPVVSMKDLGHAVEWRLRVAALAGGLPVPPRIRIPVTPGELEEARDLLATFGVPREAIIVGFQPGASSHARQWPPARFAELAAALQRERPNICIVVNSAPSEGAVVGMLLSALPEANGVVYTRARIPMRLLPAVIANMDAFVTGDTGPLHLAIAVDTPTVSLFAVSNPAVSGPFQDPERHIVIHRPCSSGVCDSKRCAYAEPKCMNAITAEEVAAGVLRLIDAAGAGSF